MRKASEFVPLRLARMSISDRHTAASDNTGQWLDEVIEQQGHVLAHRVIVPSNLYQIRAQLSDWIVRDDIDVLLTHGGTGFANENCTEAAIRPLLDRRIDGFGELFRHLSYDDIGSSALQSQAFAGFANHKVIFAIPGSQGAARLAWNSLIQPQLDARQGPCNFVGHIKRGQCDD